ncbi:MAG: type IX secretion system membrane protein PorP/SprF [Chitinophagaceae bacterium]|nr:MAG: type IX secretion system membrane protein PorP/SprF [Chitinophagaceae bacterium]
MKPFYLKLKYTSLKRSCFLLLLLAATAQRSEAQVDPHFSQYYVYPSWLNPALTGAFDGNYRVAGIYRSQWGSTGSPFKTSGLSFDATTARNINFGASIINQTAGDGGYNYTTAYGNVAYTGVRLGAGDFHRIVFGLQAGMIQRRFNPSKLTFGDQWNPITGYNPGSQTAENLGRRSASSFDAGAGVLYFDATPGKKANIYGGFSVSHLTRPTDQFSSTGNAVIPMRYTVHGGVRIQLSESFSLTPNFLYLKQGTAQEKMIGAYGQLKASETSDFLLGANYRFNDAFSPYAGFTYKNFVLGVSYDVNNSDLGRMSGRANSFELSLTFIGRRTVRTPEAEFVCPSL